MKRFDETGNKMLEPIQVAEQILRAIKELGAEGERSKELIIAKAEATGEYDKALGIATTKLKADGCSVSIIEKTAKGNVYDLLIKKIVAEESLKAHYSKLSRLEAQLNGLQSINRYLQTVSQ